LWCGKEFESKFGAAKFCSTTHRSSYFRKQNPGYRGKKKNLNGSEQLSSTSMTIPEKKLERISNQLDPASQMIFDLMKEQTADLREKNKELTDENKTLLKEKGELNATHVKEKAALEKQVEDLNRALNDKPTGLNGFLSDSEVKNKLVDGLLAMGQSFMDRNAAQQQQLTGGTQELPMVSWLRGQPEPIQKDFMAMVSKLAEDNAKLAERLASINRSLMGVAPQQQQQQVNASNPRRSY
jgi:hypothetical protein